ncbi:MAG: MucR family transcriptional regulator [Deltaproteobacteria bacterium]|nr:MucR family transcriptional regulator [Deltaproteobacteria bacterium]
MAKTLTEMAAEIIAAKAARSDMNQDALNDALNATFNALAQLRNKEESQDQTETVSDASDEEMDALVELRKTPKRSIRKNKVICLECGQEFKQLTNGHLKEHGLTTKEYRKKWGFTARQPLSSQNLSAKRRKSAEERGLGEKLKLARQQKAANAESTGKKGGRKKASKKSE